MPQSDNTSQVHEVFERLHTLRDQIRLGIHLGGMDLRDHWHELQGQLEEIERDAKRASDTTLETLKKFGTRLEVLAEQLHLDAP